jgi:hypothetical protein
MGGEALEENAQGSLLLNQSNKQRGNEISTFFE